MQRSKSSFEIISTLKSRPIDRHCEARDKRKHRGVVNNVITIASQQPGKRSHQKKEDFLSS